MRILFVFFFICNLTYLTKGQTRDNLDSVWYDLRPKMPIVNFGVKLGMNYSNTNFNRGYPTPPIPVVTTWRSGFVAGFLLRITLSNKFSVQQEYLYSELGGEIKDESVIYKFNYFSLPLFINFNVLRGVAVKVGPQFDILVSADEYKSGNNSNIIHQTEARNFGINTAIEIQLIKRLSLDLRYMHGINHININTRSTAAEFKYEVLQSTLNVKF